MQPFRTYTLTLASLIIGVAGMSSCGGHSEPLPSDCSVFPTQQTSPYVLPYQVGQSYSVGHTTGHGGTWYYAVDFGMPIGTPIVASRSGTVVNLQMSFVNGDTTPGHENFIWIEHPDNTVARYFHLSQGSAYVANGDVVAQGQTIALSDNTGNSTGPHLHFDVVQCFTTGTTLTDFGTLPCGQTLPLTFKNTIPHSCGVEVGTSYPARAY